MAHRQACETKCIALEEDEEDEEGAYWKSMGMAWEAVKPLTFWNVHLQRIVARNLFDIDMFELLCSEDTNRAKAGCFLMSRRLSRKPTFSHRSFDVPYYIILHHITSYYIILHHITSYYIILHHIASYCIILPYCLPTVQDTRENRCKVWSSAWVWCRTGLRIG